ncbi:cyclophilin-like fold protein [Lacrimispora sp. 38-1]|uniref:cyclophilin-like fold protein n=1 Tax=Lacrimispora sp. 38-1 TaxID=3125778 RepID=UPI003CF52097
MNKKITFTFLSLVIVFLLTACSNAQSSTTPSDSELSVSENYVPGNDNSSLSKIIEEPIENNQLIKNSDSPAAENSTKLTVSIDDYHFSAFLYDNDYSKAFFKMLPITLEMSDLNGNEKYYYLDNTLPTDSENPKQIKSGDIMLYGDNCLVLFYKSFSSSYSYTKLGYIEDTSNLEKAVGSGDVPVTISIP